MLVILPRPWSRTLDSSHFMSPAISNHGSILQTKPAEKAAQEAVCAGLEPVRNDGFIWRKYQKRCDSSWNSQRALIKERNMPKREQHAKQTCCSMIFYDCLHQESQSLGGVSSHPVGECDRGTPILHPLWNCWCIEY